MIDGLSQLSVTEEIHGPWVLLQLPAGLHHTYTNFAEFFTSGHSTCCEDESSFSFILPWQFISAGRCVKVFFLLWPLWLDLHLGHGAIFVLFIQSLEKSSIFGGITGYSMPHRVQKGQGIRLFLLDEAVGLRPNAAAEEMNSEVGFILKMT